MRSANRSPRARASNAASWSNGLEAAGTDTNGVYFVLTSSDVHKSGFGTSYCGWHSNASIGGKDIKYGFIGDPSVQYPLNCGAQATGPNGSSGVDAMASIIAHELEEETTDPDLNAWILDPAKVTGQEFAQLVADLRAFHGLQGILAQPMTGTER